FRARDARGLGLAKLWERPSGRDDLRALSQGPQPLQAAAVTSHIPVGRNRGLKSAPTVRSYEAFFCSIAPSPMFAGPLITWPSAAAKRDPWHGQSQVLSTLFQRTEHPRCGHT